MDLKISQHVELLLYGSKTEAGKAKNALKKELERELRLGWKSKEQADNDRKIFSKEILSVYEKLFGAYENIKNHNKCPVLSFLSHALFFFEDNHEYFEIFLGYVREALKNELDGNLRHIAVTTNSNTYCVSTVGLFRPLSKSVSAKLKKNSDKYQEIIVHHITEIFDALETRIEKVEENFPEAVEYMKPSVVKSHLLYLLEFDNFDVLSDLNGLFEDPSPYQNNENYKKWRAFYQPLLKTHPQIEKFITHVPHFDSYKYEEFEEYEDGDIPEMVQAMLDAPEKEEEGILSAEFFAGVHRGNNDSLLGDFAVPKDAYFEIMDIVQDVDDRDVLFETFNKVYIHALNAPVSEIYWYDLVNSILREYGDIELSLRILNEGIKKLSSKIDVNVPPHTDGKNNIHYGIHEHRPVFRVLSEYAMHHHEYGDKKIAIQYYNFLLALNPFDNQGVRYLLSALYAGKPASYTDELFDEGNRTQNWDKVENFLNEQNAKHHFWNEPAE